MSTVVNSGDLRGLFEQLGWSADNDLLQAVLNSAVPASVVVLYLQALINSPGALNDQTIAGVTPSQGTQITGFFKSKGLVGT